jgi:hypothetical protein
MTVVYDALILSLRMAPKKDKAIISDKTANGELAPKSVNANPALMFHNATCQGGILILSQSTRLKMARYRDAISEGLG